MALLRIHHHYYFFNYRLNTLLVNNLIRNFYEIRRHVRKSTGNDTTVKSVDDFTTQLTQEKSAKWDSINITRKYLFELLKNRKKQNAVFNLYLMNNINFELYLKNCIDNQDVDSITMLVNKIVENNRKISKTCLINLISFCGHYGDNESVLKLIKFGETMQILDEEGKLNCRQYIAETLWIKGNVQEAIAIFKELYDKHVELRRNTSLLIRFLIGRTMELRAEAVLVQIIKFVEELAVEYNDFAPICCLWEACLFSEWFSDQKAALELLEFNTVLRAHLIRKYKYIISKAIRLNKIEIVQNLFEVFLKLKMTDQYILLLRMLFDYYHWQRDFRHCSEIIRWSINLNIPLRIEQNTKFVNMLVDQYDDNQNKIVVKPEKLRAPQFKLKF